MHHRPRCRHEIRFANVVPLFFLRDHALNKFRQFFVARTAPHLRVQIMIPDRKQASANLAVAGDTDAAAMSTERMRNGSDDSNLTDAVVEVISTRSFENYLGDCIRAKLIRRAIDSRS